jgi:uncharacterized protein
MLIGVLSDTHFPSIQAGLKLFDQLRLGAFAGVELILHAGDVGAAQVLDGLLDVPVLAVRGNTDFGPPWLPEQRTLVLEGYRIGLIHGWGPAAGLEARVLGQFAHTALDCLIYGHSHAPLCERRNGLFLFNPGSPTDRRSAPRHTVGLLELGSTLSGRILSLDPP